jgi:hypothetical protein
MKNDFIWHFLRKLLTSAICCISGSGWRHFLISDAKKSRCRNFAVFGANSDNAAQNSACL